MESVIIIIIISAFVLDKPRNTLKMYRFFFFL